MTKITIFSDFWDPIYWDLGQKTTKNTDTSSAFFEVFLGIFDPVYTGNLGKTGVFWSKLANFG